MKTAVVAKEVRMFWRVCQELKSEDPQIVADAIDEMDVLRMHTDNPVLKEQCSRMIERLAARAAGEVGRNTLPRVGI